MTSVMEKNKKRFIGTLLIVTLICSFAISSLTSIEAAAYSTVVSVSNKTISVNKLSLGVQIQTSYVRSFPTSTSLQNLFSQAKIKTVRIFDFENLPCTNWNSATHTGTFNWNVIDTFLRSIYNLGAEPILCIGSRSHYIPNMATNPTTGLPYPDDFAAYCAYWINHIKSLNLPVRYYEIINEPQFYFGTSGASGTTGWHANLTKVGYFMELFGLVSETIKAANPNAVVMPGDYCADHEVLDYWLANNGPDLGAINYHPYGSGEGDPTKPNYVSDQSLFNRVETKWFTSDPLGRSVMDSQTLYYNSRGKTLPLINSESNLDADWTPTDKRIVQMCGAVWLALLIRMEMLQGVEQNIWFYFATSKSWHVTNNGGYGFGMINTDDMKPWFPYYVYKFVGNNLAVGDSILETKSSSDDIRAISWVNAKNLNILLICKASGTRSVTLSGVNGIFNYFKIDDPTNSMIATEQIGKLDASQPITMNGYTVMLLQAPMTVKYNLTITSGLGGTTNHIPGTYTYNKGDIATVSAIPSAGYKFDHWMLDGVSYASNPINIAMDSDHTLEVVFSLIPAYTLSIQTTTGGTTNPETNSYTYYEGDTATVTAIPSSGYVFDYWMLDGQSYVDNPISILMNANHTLKAVFSVKPVAQGVLEAYSYYGSRVISTPVKILGTGQVIWTPFKVTLNAGTYHYESKYHGRTIKGTFDILENQTTVIQLRFKYSNVYSRYSRLLPFFF